MKIGIAVGLLVVLLCLQQASAFECKKDCGDYCDESAVSDAECPLTICVRCGKQTLAGPFYACYDMGAMNCAFFDSTALPQDCNLVYNCTDPTSATTGGGGGGGDNGSTTGPSSDAPQTPCNIWAMATLAVFVVSLWL